ncbi:MAG: epimerase [Sphingobium sp.]|jgi:dTDP-L-rhamnose 4-epimerase|nr:epimerase [Sphingobium sp.]HCV03815.1 epimerase [Pseudoalteromonas sp.]|tara:strand:+ start:1405 stop:2538 length:1134 start_codon:yes stop_codon:yes gene_type:complete
MKKILVTGGAGFIGSHLCPLLRQNGFNVTILDNLSPQIHGESQTPPSWISEYGIDFVKGSVTERSALESVLRTADGIIHLAAETGTGQSMYEIEKYNLVNSQATALMLDIITNEKLPVKRILLASSRSVYGEGAYISEAEGSSKKIYPRPRLPEELANHQWTAKDRAGKDLIPVPTHEDDKIQPASIYASTKYAQEDLIAICCESLGIGYGILRLQNVYGEGQSLNNPYTGILSIFSTRVRMDKHLPIFEDGLETRDFVHVSDVAGAFLSALKRVEAPNTIINVGTGQFTTVIDIAEQLTRAFGKEPDIRVTGQYRVGDIRHNCADITRLKEVLDYTPKVSLEEGMKRFVDWVNTQPLPEDKLDKANQELKEKNLMG